MEKHVSGSAQLPFPRVREVRENLVNSRGTLARFRFTKVRALTRFGPLPPARVTRVTRVPRESRERAVRAAWTPGRAETEREPLHVAGADYLKQRAESRREPSRAVPGLSPEMPLLHRKPFVRHRPPPDLDPDEEVFLCKITHEVFRSYDEFFERTILCNSLVWSCALTGRAGLTYLEAVDSERKARSSLQNFPEVLLRPLLVLVRQSRSKRLSELCEDVYNYCRDRFFTGETVDVSTRGGLRVSCQVMQVLSPHSSTNGSSVNGSSVNGSSVNGSSVNGSSVHKTEGDSIVISDSDEEQPSPAPHINGRRVPLSPSVFRYKVKPVSGNTDSFTVNSSQLSRRKNVLSREKMKLLFKHHCEPRNGAIVLKSSTVSRFGLSDVSFTQFFPDEPPVFSSAPKTSPAQSALSQLEAMEERLRLLQQKEDMTQKKKDKTKEEKKRRREEKKQRRREEEEEERHQDHLKEKKKKKAEREEKIQERVSKWEEEKRSTKEEQELKKHMKKEREEMKRKKLEEREMQRAEREKEREKLKEERRKFAERIKQMNKPTEDLDCDDLQDLPRPALVRTRLEPHLFGEALMVLEFLKSFGEIFDLKDEFPDGVTLDVLEEALVGSDPEGPLCELLFFFLSAIFQSSDQDERTPRDETEVLEDAADSASAAAATTTAAAWAWSHVHQGRSLRQLELDSCTLSEILRLQILSESAPDDPCVELQLTQPRVLHRLRSTAVYDLHPEEKLQILKTLVGKLLTLSRDLIEDSVDEQRSARVELREIRAEQHRREREEAAYRVRRRKEERLKEQEQRMKEKEEKLREQENISVNGSEPKTKNQDQDQDQDQDQEKDLQKIPDSGPVHLTPEELEKEQEKVRELLVRLHSASSCTSLLPLGRDRWYRKYWLLPSQSALFVEEDTFGLSADMRRPEEDATPLSPATPPTCNGHTQGEESEEGGDSSAPIITDSAPHTPVSAPTPHPPHSGSRWSFFWCEEQLERLLQSLTPRGHRESALRDALTQERARITAALHTCDEKTYAHTDEQRFPECTAAESVMEAKLRDLLLDIEDRVYQGTLGSLKVAERQVWRAALEAGHYHSLIDSCEDECMDDSDGLGSSRGRRGVRALAAALSHIERGIERRFLKPPLGEEEVKKEQKKKNQSSEEVCESGVVRSLLERWRESLNCCSSLSQVFVHLSTLDRSVLWSRSLLNTRCRICRRKGDADNMLLCDACDRGHHTHCLRPRLKSIPSGDWFCPDCKPKQRSTRITSRTRTSTHREEEETEDEETEEDGEEEEDDEETEDSEEQEDEEEEDKPPPSKKSSAPPPKGRNQSASSRSQQATPKNTGSSAKSRSSGKKASPPSSKAPPPKAPPRAGSRSSARLSLDLTHEKTTPETTPSSQTRAERTRPVLSSGSASGSRRSSGRSHGVHELSACELLAVELVRHDDSWPFMKLVSRTQVPDYYDIVKRPIALSVIREKVNNCEYTSAAEFVADVELMFSNCLQYNHRHSNEAKAAARLQLFFHSQLHKTGLKTEPGPRTGLKTEPGPRTGLKTEPGPRTGLKTEPGPETNEEPPTKRSRH